MPSAVQALTADQLNSISSQLNHAKDNRGPEILAVNVVLFVICALAVVLRVYSRRIAKVKLWWDDWIIIADLVRLIDTNYARGDVAHCRTLEDQALTPYCPVPRPCTRH